ncbi:MAG: DMT family transporter, partial [Candidatus Nucleicultricaceae bacterium]
MIVSCMSSKNKSILFMLAATGLYSINDAFAKLIVAGYPVGHFFFIRSVMTLMILIPFLRSASRRQEIGSNFKLNVLRSSVAAGGTMIMFLTLKFMPLADCILLFFTSPLFAFLLAKPILGEKLSRITFFAVLLGFMGASIVAFPGYGVIDPIALVVLGAALLLGLSNVISRKLTFHTSAYSVTFNYTVVSLLFGSVLFFSDMHLPTGEQFLLIAMMSIVNLLAQYGMINAFKYGEVNAIAPLEYVELIYMMILGFIIWGDIPTLKLI